MNNPKTLNDLTLTELNAELCIRMEQIEVLNQEIALLRGRRQAVRSQPPATPPPQPAP